MSFPVLAPQLNKQTNKQPNNHFEFGSGLFNPARDGAWLQYQVPQSGCTVSETPVLCTLLDRLRTGAPLLDQGLRPESCNAADGCDALMSLPSTAIAGEAAALSPSRVEVVRAAFSVVAADAEIRPHTGPTNGQLKYHFGVQIPSGPCKWWLTVAGKRHGWRHGGSILFDDSCVLTSPRPPALPPTSLPAPSPCAPPRRAAVSVRLAAPCPPSPRARPPPHSYAVHCAPAALRAAAVPMAIAL